MDYDIPCHNHEMQWRVQRTRQTIEHLVFAFASLNSRHVSDTILSQNVGGAFVARLFQHARRCQLSREWRALTGAPPFPKTKSN